MGLAPLSSGNTTFDHTDLFLTKANDRIIYECCSCNNKKEDNIQKEKHNFPQSYRSLNGFHWR